MLKYLYCKEVFQEIPSEIILGISISGCRIRCVGCHSKELWEDTGTPLTPQCLEVLLQGHRGISCLLLLGGEHDIPSLQKLFKYARSKGLKTAWYSGLDKLPEDCNIASCLDYLKLGHYDQSLGGLSSPTTNQHLYQIIHSPSDSVVSSKDITHLLQTPK